MRAKGVLRNLRRGNYAKVVAALTPGSHQLVDWTAPDRYPEIFAAAAAAAPDARRILSFGCSTGEECVSLAQYFPKAEIVGAEINVLSLLKAMKKRSDRTFRLFQRSHLEQARRIRRGVLHGRAAGSEKATASATIPFRAF
jgi:tRNA G46 methylase TrmB